MKCIQNVLHCLGETVFCDLPFKHGSKGGFSVLVLVSRINENS